MKIIGKHWQSHSHNLRFSGKPCLIAGGYWKWKICHEQKLRNKYACKFNRETLRVNPMFQKPRHGFWGSSACPEPNSSHRWLICVASIDFPGFWWYWFMICIEIYWIKNPWKMKTHSIPQLSMLYVFPALSSQVWGSLARLRPGSIGHVGWSKNESSPSTKHPLQRKRNAWTSFYYWGIGI